MAEFTAIDLEFLRQTNILRNSDRIMEMLRQGVNPFKINLKYMLSPILNLYNLGYFKILQYIINNLSSGLNSKIEYLNYHTYEITTFHELVCLLNLMASFDIPLTFIRPIRQLQSEIYDNFRRFYVNNRKYHKYNILLQLHTSSSTELVEIPNIILQNQNESYNIARIIAMNSRLIHKYEIREKLTDEQINETYLKIMRANLDTLNISGLQFLPFPSRQSFEQIKQKLEIIDEFELKRKPAYELSKRFNDERIRYISSNLIDDEREIMLREDIKICEQQRRLAEIQQQFENELIEQRRKLEEEQREKVRIVRERQQQREEEQRKREEEQLQRELKIREEEKIRREEQHFQNILKSRQSIKYLFEPIREMFRQLSK